MGSTKEEQERVKNLLLDTVTLLCKNGLNFKQQLKVQGLLGITLDDESVFIVHIDEKVGEAVVDKKDQEETSDQSSIDSRRSSRDSQLTPNKNRKRHADSIPLFGDPPDKVRVKMEKVEPNEDLILIDNNVDDKSLIKAQIYQQQQHAGMPSISNIQGGYPHLNPQNTGQKPMGPFVTGNSQHGLSQINTPGGTPEKQQLESFAASVWMPRSQRRNIPDQEKQFICDHPGCGLAYNIRCNLLRHQSLKHGRKNVKRNRTSDFILKEFSVLPATVSDSNSSESCIERNPVTNHPTPTKNLRNNADSETVQTEKDSQNIENNTSLPNIGENNTEMDSDRTKGNDNPIPREDGEDSSDGEFSNGNSSEDQLQCLKKPIDFD